MSFFLTVTVSGLDLVSAGIFVLGAFDLHTPGAKAGVEDEIIALAVSPGLADGETQTGGFYDEGGFG